MSALFNWRFISVTPLWILTRHKTLDRSATCAATSNTFIWNQSRVVVTTAISVNLNVDQIGLFDAGQIEGINLLYGRTVAFTYGLLLSDSGALWSGIRTILLYRSRQPCLCCGSASWHQPASSVGGIIAPFPSDSSGTAGAQEEKEEEHQKVSFPHSWQVLIAFVFAVWPILSLWMT